MVTFLKNIFSNVISGTIAGLIIVALTAGGFRLFYKKIWDWLISKLVLPTPLWVIICLVVIFLMAYLHLKSKKPVEYPTDQFIEKTDRFRKKFFVLWDEDHNMRCNYCMTLLKPASKNDPSNFYCSNRQCDSKYYLKDNDGNKVTYQEALDSFKAEKVLAASGAALSAVANAILEIYVVRDTTDLNLKTYIGALPFTKIEAESGIDELRNKGIIISYTSHGEYGLTDAGKKLLARKLSKNK
jgi:hypothetical protein